MLDPSELALTPRAFTGLNTQQLAPQICGMSGDEYYLKNYMALFITNAFEEVPGVDLDYMDKNSKPTLCLPLITFGTRIQHRIIWKLIPSKCVDQLFAEDEV